MASNEFVGDIAGRFFDGFRATLETLKAFARFTFSTSLVIIFGDLPVLP